MEDSTESLRDLLFSATNPSNASNMSGRSLSPLLSSLKKQQQQGKKVGSSPTPLNESDLLAALTGKSAGAGGSPLQPMLSMGSRPAPFVAEAAASDLELPWHEAFAAHMPISNFKATSLKPCEGQLVAANDKYIGYVVGRKRVRLLGQDAGQKGIMASHSKGSESDIVAVGLNGELLGSLTEGGELLIGSVYEESRESLGYEPVVALTFPELAPARGLAWSPTDSPHRAIICYGSSASAAFLVWIDPKPQAVEVPHSLDGAIEGVCFFGRGRFVAIADAGSIQCFRIDSETRELEPVAQYSLETVAPSRVWLFADGEDGLVVAALSASPRNTVVAASIRIGVEPFWMRSSLRFDVPSQVSVVFDALMQVLVMASLHARDFHVLALRSDANGFAHMSAEWREAGMPVLSLALCPEMRNLEKGLHIPLYVYQSEWVYFYALRLPKPDDILTPTAPTPSERQPKRQQPVVAASKPPQTPDLAGALVVDEALLERIVSKAGQKLEERMEAVARDVLTNRLVPAVEAACSEILRQVGAREQAQTMAATSALEAKVDALQSLVQEIKASIDTLPSAKDLEKIAVSAGSSLQDSGMCGLPSGDDAIKAELDQLVASGNNAGALLKALDAGSLEVLTWVLGRLDPVAALEGGLPAPVLLSLIQQLGADLSTATDLKLEWLAEIFTTTYTPAEAAADPSLAQLASQVLEDLFSNLRVYFAQASADPQTSKKLKFIMREVRRLI